MATIPWLGPGTAVAGGDDLIFEWYGRYLDAVARGKDAINGTVGVLLDDEGELALNGAMMLELERLTPTERAAYAPLRGVEAFRTFLLNAVFGASPPSSASAFATPGGCGALFASAKNLTAPGDRVLLRDHHWGPYRGILEQHELGIRTWPLIGPRSGEGVHVDVDAFGTALLELAQEQARVLIWLNDPAHNPTGLSLDGADRGRVLATVLNMARTHPNVGFSLVIDAAYAAYSSDSKGWGRPLSELRGQPENLLLAVAVSCSKSHTCYGARAGGLVTLHPNAEARARLEEVLLHTGRGTWSGAPRGPQMAIARLHGTRSGDEAWAKERTRLNALLEHRRAVFLDIAQSHGLSLLPCHDGYFAWHPCENPEAVAEQAALEDVYVVPLRGGVRIGLCAIPAERMRTVVRAIQGGGR